MTVTTAKEMSAERVGPKPHDRVTGVMLGTADWDASRPRRAAAGPGSS